MSEQPVPGRAPVDPPPRSPTLAAAPLLSLGHRGLLCAEGVARSRGRGRSDGARESRFPAGLTKTEMTRVSPSVWSGGSLSAATASAAFRKLSWAPTNSFLEKRCSPRSISICKGGKLQRIATEQKTLDALRKATQQFFFVRSVFHFLFALLLIARRNTFRSC